MKIKLTVVRPKLKMFPTKYSNGKESQQLRLETLLANCPLPISLKRKMLSVCKGVYWDYTVGWDIPGGSLGKATKIGSTITMDPDSTDKVLFPVFIHELAHLVVYKKEKIVYPTQFDFLASYINKHYKERKFDKFKQAFFKNYLIEGRISGLGYDWLPNNIAAGSKRASYALRYKQELLPVYIEYLALGKKLPKGLALFRTDLNKLISLLSEK